MLILSNSALFNILKGDNDLNSPCYLTAEARTALDHILAEVSSAFADQARTDLPFCLFAINNPFQPLAIFGQFEPSQLIILEWCFLSRTPKKTLTTPLELLLQIIDKA